MKQYMQRYEQLLNKTHLFEGIAPLLVRLYLAPIMLQAGWQKLSYFENTVVWFDQQLGFPLPWLMALLATAVELFGGVLLIFGLAIRTISLPLMVTMLVAAFSVHSDNGWLTIADAQSWLALGNSSIQESVEKLSYANDILNTYGNYQWLTSSGKFVILNNGMEMAITYFVMLLMLFFYGAGRYTSLDYFIKKKML